MKVLVVLCALVAITSARRCFTGTRSAHRTYGTVYDTSFSSVCDEDQDYCVKYTYVQTIEDDGNYFNVTTNYGECKKREEAEAASCASFLPFVTPYGEVHECNVEFCDNNGTRPCLSFDAAPGKSDCDVKEDDVRAFPACSMRETLEGAFKCVNPFLLGYPHTDKDSCMDGLDRAVECVAGLIRKCTESNCPTVLDSLPGWRSRYSEFSFYASFVTNGAALAEFVGNVTEGDVDLREMYKQFVCHENGTEYNDEVRGLVESLRQNTNVSSVDRTVTELFPDFGCPNVFQKLANTGFEFLHDFYQANDTRQVFRLFNGYARHVREAFENCNMDAVIEGAEEAFEALNFTVSRDDFETFVKVAVEYTQKGPRPQDCPAEHEGHEYGTVELDCERFYNATSRCARRKAWACNFAEWRFNFLRTWLSEFYKRYDDAELPTPSCGNDAEYVDCKESDLCCYDAPKGCRLCYCTGHDYKNSNADILESWRQSYQDWSQFFRKYQEFASRERLDECH